MQPTVVVDPTTTTHKRFDLDWLLACLRRRKWLALVSFAAMLAATTTITHFLPNIYQATSTLLVVGQQVPVEFVRSTVTGAVDSRLQAISQEILSRSRLEELITRFRLYPELGPDAGPEAGVTRMRRDVEVRPNGLDRAGGTIAFTIRYQGRDPELVALVTNTLASYYIEENMKVRERQATGTALFLRTQLDEVKTRLEAQERRASEFRRKNLGELPQQMDANLATLERLNTQFRLNSEKQLRAREQKQELSRLIDSFSLLGATAPTPKESLPRTQGSAIAATPQPQADGALIRLNRMKQELADLRTRFSDKYPDVIRLQNEIASLERQVAETRRENAEREKAERDRLNNEKPATGGAAPEPASPTADPYVVQLQQSLSQLEVELKMLSEEEKTLRSSMQQYQSRVENTPRRDLEFQELSRDYDSTKELYRTLLKRYEEAQLSESLEQRQKGEQFKILEPAVTPTTPSAPNRLRFFALGFVLSLGLAVGLVAVAEVFDTSFHSIDDLRSFTSTPVLVSIPRIVTESDARRARWRARLMTAATAVALTLIVTASYFVARGNEQLLRLLMPGHP